MSDPEINAMATISKELDGLDEPTIDRVLRWARDRYGKPASPRETAPAWRGQSSNRAETLPREQVDFQYTDIADVYGAANPSTDSEKVLVVGYWFQKVRGESELDSQTLNSELKNLGYPIGNMTRAVSALASTVPRYVIQTKKSGSSKQARKKFRLTTEGLKRVEQMLGGATVAAPRTGSDWT